MECNLDKISVYYETYGEGKPVLMLHGWSLDRQHLVDEMEPLFQGRPGWRRIYPDLPGHGRTPGADWIANADIILGVVLDFIDHVIQEERFILAGISWGAYLARGVVQQKASQVDGLMMSVPLIVAPDAQRTLPRHMTLVEDPAVLAELKTDEEWLEEMAVVQSLELLARVRSAPGIAEPGGDLAFQERIRLIPENYAFSYDVDALAQPFPAPTLILTGRQDASVGYRDAWKIVENYPRATFAVLDMAGHLLGYEQETLFRTLVSEWLDRVEIYA
jgi:pimeloyl-ACP methyl ester carboxylesterase